MSEVDSAEPKPSTPLASAADVLDVRSGRSIDSVHPSRLSEEDQVDASGSRLPSRPRLDASGGG